jgi:AraC-like DNA-binding protein
MKSNSRDKVIINSHLKDLNPLFVGSEKCESGHSYGPNVRKYTLIHYVVAGKGIVYKKGEVYPVRAGEAFLIHPNEIVTYTADEVDPWYYQWVAFDGELTEKLIQLPTVIDFPSGLIQEMLEAVEQELPAYRVTALLYRMYAELFEGKKTRHHYVRRVQDYIRALYMKPIRVEEIAQEMNLDRRYLSRLFKEKMGQSIQEYLITVRLEEAQRYLEEGFSVEESAVLCGYEDACNFSKMFKRRFGVSPLYWKRDRS